MASIKKIILLGGGTGGHVFPLVAVAQSLQEKAGEGVALRFMGEGSLLKEEAAKLGLKCYSILAPKWRRYFSFLNAVDILKVPLAVIQSFFWVWWLMPDAIFSKGGYASFFPVLAGKLMAIPIFIHESDAVPGASNRFLSKLAVKTFASLENSRILFNTKNFEAVGNPIRKEIFQNYDRPVAAAAFGLDSQRPTILITGANQGAQKINDMLFQALVELVKEFQIIHQTGPKNYEEVDENMKGLIKEGQNSFGDSISKFYRIYPSLDASQMAMAYAVSDVVVSRGGSQIFETAALGKPTVVIPLKISSGNHQQANALEFTRFGALVIEEDNLTPHMLIGEIKKAYAQRETIIPAIRQFGRLDAASRIADQLLNYTS